MGDVCRASHLIYWTHSNFVFVISIQRSNLKFHADRVHSQFWLCWIDTHDIERCTTKFDFLTRSEFLSSTGQSVYGKKT